MDLLEICHTFVNKKFVKCDRYGNGHINVTYLAVTEDNELYILQKINNYVFKDVDLLMNNIVSVTSFLKKKNITSIQMIKVKDKYYLIDNNDYYRMYKFMDHTITVEKPESIELVKNAAKAFGRFHNALSDMDASLLKETIPDFHLTPKRYQNLLTAVKLDKCNRLKEVKRELEIINKYKDKLSLITDGIRDGEVKLHITHNDPKINNVLFNEDDLSFHSIIDLDTVMPGSVLYDFGDALRSLFTGDKEDSKEYTKVVGDISIYKEYLSSYYEEAKPFLTIKEKELLPYAPFILTIECGIRFLEDYLNGDVYFHTKYKEHNLDRARTQLNLASSIIENIALYQKVTKEIISK